MAGCLPLRQGITQSGCGIRPRGPRWPSHQTAGCLPLGHTITRSGWGISTLANVFSDSSLNIPLGNCYLTWMSWMRRAIGTFLSLSAKTRLSQTQISINRPPFIRWGIWRFPQSLFGFGNIHVHKVHTHEVHAREMHAHEMHACEMYVCEGHTHEMHAHEMHVYEVHACGMHVYPRL
jgi:hypothetical protein